MILIEHIHKIDDCPRSEKTGDEIDRSNQQCMKNLTTFACGRKQVLKTIPENKRTKREKRLVLYDEYTARARRRLASKSDMFGFRIVFRDPHGEDFTRYLQEKVD